MKKKINKISESDLHSLNNEILPKLRWLNSKERHLESYPMYFRLLLSWCRALGKDQWDAGFPEAILVRQNLKQTKKNLKKFLKDEVREKQFAFDISNRPCIKIAYQNPIIQSFFEFSLFYSWMKNIELSAQKARSIFTKATQVSLGQSLETAEKTNAFIELIKFIQGGTAVLNHTILPNGKVGNKPDPENQEILKLRPMSYRKIALHFAYIELKKFTESYIAEGLSERDAKEKAKEKVDDEWIKTKMKKAQDAVRNDKKRTRESKVSEKSNLNCSESEN